VDCTVSRIDASRLLVRFVKRQSAATPGQFAVFYAGDRCLGGAIIDRTIAADSLRKTG
jgi:tRNA-specific 2-thiouridylase